MNENKPKFYHIFKLSVKSVGWKVIFPDSNTPMNIIEIDKLWPQYNIGDSGPCTVYSFRKISQEEYFFSIVSRWAYREESNRSNLAMWHGCLINGNANDLIHKMCFSIMRFHFKKYSYLGDLLNRIANFNYENESDKLCKSISKEISKLLLGKDSSFEKFYEIANQLYNLCDKDKAKNVLNSEYPVNDVIRFLVSVNFILLNKSSSSCGGYIINPTDYDVICINRNFENYHIVNLDSILPRNDGRIFSENRDRTIKAKNTDKKYIPHVKKNDTAKKRMKGQAKLRKSFIVFLLPLLASILTAMFSVIFVNKYQASDSDVSMPMIDAKVFQKNLKYLKQMDSRILKTESDLDTANRKYKTLNNSYIHAMNKIDNYSKLISSYSENIKSGHIEINELHQIIKQKDNQILGLDDKNLSLKIEIDNYNKLISSCSENSKADKSEIGRLYQKIKLMDNQILSLNDKNLSLKNELNISKSDYSKLIDSSNKIEIERKNLSESNAKMRNELLLSRRELDENRNNNNKEYLEKIEKQSKTIDNLNRQINECKARAINIPPPVAKSPASQPIVTPIITSIESSPSMDGTIIIVVHGKGIREGAKIELEGAGIWMQNDIVEPHLSGNSDEVKFGPMKALKPGTYFIKVINAPNIFSKPFPMKVEE